MPADLTFEKLTWDLDALERAEAAFEAEASREYDFSPVHTEESIDRESELIEQST